MKLTECIEHLITLILTGRLDDELARDRDAVIACVLRIISGLAGKAADKLDPDHAHAVYGSEAVEDQELFSCCCKLADVLDLEVPLAATADGLPIWVNLLIPILMKLLERWLEDQEG